MFAEGEPVFYYLTLQNENYAMPAMREGVEQGIVKGLYRFKQGDEGAKHRAQIFGSGAIMNEALRAQKILVEKFDVCADVWSATSYKLLRNEALRCRRWNILHPAAEPRKSYVETLLASEQGPFVTVTDYMRIVPDQIAPWVPGGLVSLGTDGFGRSDIRPRLRRFFEVDAEMIAVAVLYALAQKGAIDMADVAKAVGDLGIDPEKAHPEIV
jgi:pyruvate dehydrogenase E1 component